jgi:hypothetical protein
VGKEICLDYSATAKLTIFPWLSLLDVHIIFLNSSFDMTFGGNNVGRVNKRGESRKTKIKNINLGWTFG